jgi:hypothetical protein
MTAIEERLHELRYTVGVPSLPDVDELAGRATRRRRRHRRRALVAAGAAVALLVPAVVIARHGDDPDIRLRTGSPGQPAPPDTTPLPVTGIPIVLLGTNVSDGSIVLSDLDAGVRTTYADGEHAIDFKTPADFAADAAAGDGSATYENVSAALTVDSELIAGVMPAPLVVFAPGQPLSEPGRQLPAPPTGGRSGRPRAATAYGSPLAPATSCWSTWRRVRSGNRWPASAAPPWSG